MFPKESMHLSSKIIGAILGLLVGIAIIMIGFFKAMFVILCTIMGYVLGKFVDNPESLRKVLDRILPPGGYK